MTIMKTYNRFDLNFEYGKGSFLYDKSGNEYLDFVAGVAVNCLGHSHPEIINTIKKQSEKMIHISNLYLEDNQINLANKLIDLSDHNSVFFCNSGTEAVEGAIKVAKKYGKKFDKDKILYFDKSFHGRSLGALSVTSKEKYKKPFMPLDKNVKKVKFNDKQDFLKKFNKDVCAVILEPIQGEGGINEIDKNFLEFIRKITIKNNCLLIFDEVQCGIGRTSKFFAYQNYNIKPDIITIAKGLGGGVPIGAFIVNKKADVLEYGDHGCTFGGNPLVTAVANTVIDIVSKKDFLKNVENKGSYLKDELKSLSFKHKEIKKIKGKGLMLGIDLDLDVKKIVNESIKNNLLVINASNKTIRLVPPLNVSKEEIDLFIKKFENVIIQLKKTIV